MSCETEKETKFYARIQPNGKSTVIGRYLEGEKFADQLRFEDFNKIILTEGMADPENDLSFEYFRLPLVKEDSYVPGQYQDESSWRLSAYDQGTGITSYFIKDLPKSYFSRAHPNGYEAIGTWLCPHKSFTPINGAEYGIDSLANASGLLSLKYIKRAGNQLLPVLKCSVCKTLHVVTWDEILPFIAYQVFHDRLVVYRDTVL